MRPFRSLLPLLAALLPPAASALQEPPPSPVRVDAVQATELQERRLVTGDVLAARRALVAAEEAGRVVEVAVDEGASVAAGDVLARLDGGRLELEVLVLESELAVARAVVDERESQLEQEERELAIVEDLRKRSAATPKELADAKTARAAAAARLAQARSQVSVLDARAALLRDRLADLEVTAPFAGIVASVETEVGEWIESGGPVVDLVSHATEAWVEVPQRYLAALRSHAGPIALMVADDGELSVADWRLVPVVDPEVRMLTVVVPLPEGAAASGMSVRAWVPVGELTTRLTVSSGALLRNEVGPYLWVAMPGGEGAPHSALPVQVDVLWREGARTVVSSPALQAGAAAIVEGNRRLHPGAPVVPVAPGAAGAGDAPPKQGAGGGSDAGNAEHTGRG